MSAACDPLLGEPIPGHQLAQAQLLPMKPTLGPAGELVGRFVVVKPYDSARDDADLVRILTGEAACGHPAYDAWALNWRYMRSFSISSGGGSTISPAVLTSYLHKLRDGHDWLLCTVFLKATAEPVGVCAYLCNRPADLVTEIGALSVTPAYQGTPVNTEACHLLLDHAFKQGYRRVEWKCNKLNARSYAAALRLGFTFEGVFRNHMVVAGCHSRDTAWLSIIDSEWAEARKRTDAWLASDAPEALFAKRRAAVEAIAAAAATAASTPAAPAASSSGDDAVSASAGGAAATLAAPATA